MKILLAHNAVSEKALADEQDVLVQVAALEEALSELGHSTTRLACTLDLERLKQALAIDPPDLVFNLVESLDGYDRLCPLFPSLLDALYIPYTGSPATALSIASNKILAKRQMSALGIQTPALLDSSDSRSGDPILAPAQNTTAWVLKSVWDHASLGLDDSCVLENVTLSEVRDLLEQKRLKTRREWFAEAYIDGREFNVSILDGPGGPKVLPPAEIVFSGFPEGRPKIVGYRAKWEPDSFEYRNTTRTFDFPEKDHTLLKKLEQEALACWKGFGLRGYARVDFRVDHSGLPHVLEINPNPCLSPDAGFAAALHQAGIGFIRGIDALVEAAKSGLRPSSLSSIQIEKRAEKGTSTGITFRHGVQPEDADTVETMTRETGFFREDEIQVAVELVEERLAKGPESGYFFVFALLEGQIAGYTCYGPIPCTLTSYDLYWIAVYPRFQNMGIGKGLLAETERLIRIQGGIRIYIETSQQNQYTSTRSFYTRCGYCLASLLEDFYSPGDAKATFCKILTPLMANDA